MELDRIFRVDKVFKRYPIGQREFEVLHNLDLEIYPGEFVILIGPSGCGKSTFMYLMLGLEPPSQGSIYFKEKDIFKMREDQRTELRSHDIAMVHQQPIWIKSLSVRENVAFPLLLHQVPKGDAVAKAGQMLKVLNLDKLANQHPHELSVGEQQRCSLMRSLITEPEVIFADEPTGNLDTDSSIVVMELIKTINERLGKTVVMVTHNMDHVAYGSKIVSMIDGKIVNVEVRRPPAKPGDNKGVSDILGTWASNAASEKNESPQEIAPAETPRTPDSPKPSLAREISKPNTEVTTS